MKRAAVAALILLTCALVEPRALAASTVDRVDALGAAADRGSPDLPPGHRAVGIAPGPHSSYWVATDDGGVQSFGGAAFHGSMGGRRLGAPVVGIAAHPSLGGYWLVGADGGVFAFGSASFHGSLAGRPLAAAVVGIAAAPDGRGYWLAAADGGVFAFGSAAFGGSVAGTRLAAPIVGIASSPVRGYWLTGADGGVFSFGGVRFHGSAGDLPLRAGVTSITATPTGKGYWLAASDGGIFTYGDALFHGVGATATEPVAAMAAHSRSGYWLLHSPAAPHPPVPPDSGSGRRIVYSNPMQRVWLVEADGTVFDSHLVSGKYHTPPAGSYAVFSKSRHTSSHNGITMDDMVRFAHGQTLPIGFHGIPRDRYGRPMQTDDDLGGFRSAGCVRQSAIDAARLYEWAPIGTPVVVLW